MPVHKVRLSAVEEMQFETLANKSHMHITEYMSKVLKEYIKEVYVEPSSEELLKSLRRHPSSGQTF